MRFLYLHGFASGPKSRKANACRAALTAEHIELEVPDLAEGDFEHLTISSQLRVIENILQQEPVRLIGSSMGGYLAALYAASHPEVDRLVLLAPAFNFAERWQLLTGPEKLRSWKETGWLPVFHYGDQADRRVHYGLYEDALLQDPNPAFPQPAVIFHGLHDDIVPIDLSRSFVQRHTNAQLREVDSDHELLNVLPEITSAAVRFLIG